MRGNMNMDVVPNIDNELYCYSNELPNHLYILLTNMLKLSLKIWSMMGKGGGRL